jgi:cobalt-precorrin 5A hydrolase
MGMDETMIAAGIGCKKGVSPDAVLAAVDAALAQHGRTRHHISRLATGTAKRHELGIVVAAGALGVPLHYVAATALADVEPRLLTRSDASARETGSPSLSEAAALAAAGKAGRLLGPRIVSGHVTCALAAMEPLP